jgi:hypothetical protein
MPLCALSRLGVDVSGDTQLHVVLLSCCVDCMQLLCFHSRWLLMLQDWHFCVRLSEAPMLCHTYLGVHVLPLMCPLFMLATCCCCCRR